MFDLKNKKDKIIINKRCTPNISNMFKETNSDEVLMANL